MEKPEGGERPVDGLAPAPVAVEQGPPPGMGLRKDPREQRGGESREERAERREQRGGGERGHQYYGDHPLRSFGGGDGNNNNREMNRLDRGPRGDGNNNNREMNRLDRGPRGDGNNNNREMNRLDRGPRGGYGRGGRNPRRGGGVSSYRGGRHGDPRDGRDGHHSQRQQHGGNNRRLEGVVQSFENVSLVDNNANAAEDKEKGESNASTNSSSSSSSSSTTTTTTTMTSGMVGWITSSKFRGGQEERFQFKEEDVMGGKAQPLVVGDRVEFYRFVDQTGGSGGEAVSHPRATRVRALDRKPKKSRGERDAERETMKGNSHSGNSGGDSINNRFHIGVVVTLKETYGFLLSFRTGCQFFFHFSEFIGSSRSNSHLPPPELQIGTVVRFILAQNPATGKDIGKSLCLMAGDGKPVFTVQQEADKRLVGKLVKRPSDLALPEDYGDGVIEFKIPSAEDNVQKKEGDANANANANAQKDNNSSNKKVEKNQKVHRAIVSKKQLNESHVHMEENDLVSFDCYRTEKVDLAIAKDVVLMRKPNEDFDSSKRELGVISVLKGSFGFITCTERIADVFLHLSQLPEDVSKEDLSVGTDVEFSVNRGAESGRLQAVDIKLAAKGSAVFEEVDEEICQGTVLERLPNKKKASHSSLLVTGLIEGLVKGKLEKLPYMYHDLDTTAASSPSAAATASATSAISSSNNQRGLGDRANNSNKMGRNPRQGDKVTFKVVVELKREKAAKLAGRPGLGRRATAVALIIREGTVVATKGSFGFIEYPKREDEIADTADAAETAGTTEAGDKDKPHAGTTGDDASSQQQTVVVEREADKPKEEEEEGSKKEEAATTDAAEKPPTPQAEEEAAKEEKDGTEQKEETTTTENADQESTDDTPAASAVTDSKKKESNKSRIFFHVSEVFDLVKLHLGDTVEFTICMNSRTQELNATRIKRTKEAVRIAKPPVHKIIEERPDHLKEFSVGSVAKGGSVVSLGRFAKGPDGTKGFSREYQISRGKTFPDPVEEAEAEEEGKKAVKTEEEGEELKSQTSLSLEAAPFVPRVEAAPFVPRTAK